MSLRTPAAFATRDHAAAARLSHVCRCAMLVTSRVPEPSISLLPSLRQPTCPPHGVLIGQLACAYPHPRRSQDIESIAAFTGPHAYVSPSGYADPDGR